MYFGQSQWTTIWRRCTYETLQFQLITWGHRSLKWDKKYITLLSKDSASTCIYSFDLALYFMKSSSCQPDLTILPQSSAAAPMLIRGHIGWALDDCKKFSWSNDRHLQLVRADGRIWVWRRPNEDIDPICQQGTVHVGGGSIMIWCVFTWHRLCPLVNLNYWLTGYGYSQLLGTICSHSWTSYTQRTRTFSRMKNHHVIGPNRFAIGLTIILDNSSELLDN